MQSMSVRPEDVNQLAGQIRSGANGIRAELDDLDRKVKKLSTLWGGDAQASYETAQHAWTKQIGELQALLEQIARKTEEISAGYVDTDKHAASFFNN